MNNLMKSFYFNAPHDRAPDWIKGKIKINIPKFVEFLQDYQVENQSDECFLEICQGKEKEDGSPGALYPRTDDYSLKKNQDG